MTLSHDYNNGIKSLKYYIFSNEQIKVGILISIYKPLSI